MKIDLNCDMGENIGNDEEIMPYITSANIACGFHAGDEMSMRETVRLAKRYGVAIGAHPSWKDREGFGRQEVSVSPEDAGALVLYQIETLDAVAKVEGLKLHHVKPHGALYNQAARDRTLADAIVRAVRQFRSDLILVGLAGSRLIEAGIEAGLTVANEGFTDRNYNADGTLVSRKQSNAIVASSQEVAAQALMLAQAGIHIQGQHFSVDTLCLHGDHPRAGENARQVRQVLERSGVSVAVF